MEAESIKYENYEDWKKLSLDIKRIFLPEHLKIADCSFNLGESGGDGKSIIIHSAQFFLIGASEVFNRMFNGEFKEANDSFGISISDVDPENFRQFLDYIYYNDTKLLEKYSVKTLTQLYYLGDKYLVEDLVKDCVNILKNTKLAEKENDDSNYILIYEFASGLNGCEEFLNKSVETLINYYKQVGCKNYSCGIYKLKLPTFYNLILKVSKELPVLFCFYMVQSYITVNSLTHIAARLDVKNDMPIKPDAESEKRLYLRLILDSIDYVRMSIEEFKKGPGQSDLLSSTRKYNILCDICSQYVERASKVGEQGLFRIKR